jgi:hypothetical protein
MAMEPSADNKAKVQTFGQVSFSRGAYTLDLSAVKDLPVKMNGEPSTFADVYCKLRDSEIREIRSFLQDTYVTEEGEIHLDGNIEEWPLRATMRGLAELFQQGINPNEVTWFFYMDDSSRDADTSYTFFAAHNGKVVMESCRFSSKEPLILKRKVEDEPIWRSHQCFDEAFEAYWYQKFYTETLMGQLMVLRPDKPILYHYERPETNNIERRLQLVTMLKTYRLLWVALPLLVALAFPALKTYMAMAAAVIGASFLWLWWKTRKVGRL